MDRVQMAETLEFSRIIQGFWRLAEWNMTKQELLSFIEDCMDMGITTFDHADIYGAYTCEGLFGEALQLKAFLTRKHANYYKVWNRSPSPKFPERYVAHYNTSAEHIMQSVEASLKNLHTDYIDVLLIHRPDPFMDPNEVAKAFSQLKQEGKFVTSVYLTSYLHNLIC